MAKVIVPSIPDSSIIEAALCEIATSNPTAYQVLYQLYESVNASRMEIGSTKDLTNSIKGYV